MQFKSVLLLVALAAVVAAPGYGKKPAYTEKPAYAPKEPAYAPKEPAYTPEEPAYTPKEPAYAPKEPAYTPEEPAYTPKEPAYTPKTYTPEAPEPVYAPKPTYGGKSTTGYGTSTGYGDDYGDHQFPAERIDKRIGHHLEHAAHAVGHVIHGIGHAASHIVHKIAHAIHQQWINLESDAERVLWWLTCHRRHFHVWWQWKCEVAAGRRKIKGEYQQKIYNSICELEKTKSGEYHQRVHTCKEKGKYSEKEIDKYVSDSYKESNEEYAKPSEPAGKYDKIYQ